MPSDPTRGENLTMHRLMTREMVIGMALGMFGLGYLCGSINQQRASAQGIGGILGPAGTAGGSLGTVGQLGSPIVEMQ
jgi:hypothetical protein